MGLMRFRVEGQHNGWDFVNPARYGGTFIAQVCVEYVVHGAVALLVDGIALWMVQGGEYPLDSERLQQFFPHSSCEFPPLIPEPPRNSKVRYDSVQQGVADCLGSVVFQWNQDGILGLTIHKGDEILHSPVSWGRAHNVNRQSFPGSGQHDSDSRAWH